jgi:hypothetical protein
VFDLDENNRFKTKYENGKNNKKFNISYILILLFKILIFLLICKAILSIFNDNKVNNVSENIEYVKSLYNIPNPSQIQTSGTITKIINGLNVEINYVAKYSITGRVVDVQNYYSSNIGDILSPKDVGISWGFLANENNHSKVRWSSMGNRYLSWYSNDGEWINTMGGVNKIAEYCSNNHLIPNDNRNKGLIDDIKEGDFVRIEGYLVNVRCKNSNGSYFYWNTSTSRTDSGEGDCEVLCVNNVTWLKTE